MEKTKTNIEAKPVIIELEAKPVIIEIEPSSDEREIIQKLSGGVTEYALVWRAFTSSEEKEKSVFSRGETITFNTDCSVAKIMAQLKADFSLEIISFDVWSQHSQALYSFKIEDRLPFESFRVQFQMDAVLKGIFKVQTLFVIEDTEHFHVNEWACFRVRL